MDKHHMSDKNTFFNGLNIADELIDSDFLDDKVKKSKSHENRFGNIAESMKNAENQRKNLKNKEN